MPLSVLDAVRYVTPLREGGSLPAVLEVSDGRLFVTKFRGAGQGAKALVAEVVAAELGRALGLPIPIVATIRLPEELARTERHDEIRDLLVGSIGDNVGLEFLPSAVMFDPAADVALDPGLASMIVAFDAYVMNVDRSPRNPNLLWSDRKLWLIDHGAALLWHHDWDGSLPGYDRPFAPIRQHVLLPAASELHSAGETLRKRLDDDTVAAAIDAVPNSLLPADPDRWKRAYAEFLSARAGAAEVFVEEAVRARGI